MKTNFQPGDKVRLLSKVPEIPEFEDYAKAVSEERVMKKFLGKEVVISSRCSYDPGYMIKGDGYNWYHEDLFETPSVPAFSEEKYNKLMDF
jgi:hypothetical protein